MRSVDSVEECIRLIKDQYQSSAVLITRYPETELDRNRAQMRVTAASYEQGRSEAVRAGFMGA